MKDKFINGLVNLLGALAFIGLVMIASATDQELEMFFGGWI